MLDLVLTGNPDLDGPRTALVRTILEHALKTCESCGCGDAVDPNLMPIERIEFLGLNLADQNGLRTTSSCYRCLRNHRNQRDHALLDRHDAAQLIREILKTPYQPQGSIGRNALTQETPDVYQFQLDDGTVRSVSRAAVQPNHGDWVVLHCPQGGGAYGEWFLTDRCGIDDTPMKWLRLRNGFGLEDGRMFTEQDLAHLRIWKHVP